MLVTLTTDQRQLEHEIRARFAVRDVEFHHGDVQWNLLLPQSAEDLLDEEAFEKDERMPYWADLWPSARALARWLLASTARSGQWLELGCGVGLPSLAVRAKGGSILATDHNADALRFSELNALRNGVGELKTMMLDWRSVPPSFSTFDGVIAADVLYEQRNASALVDLLPSVVKTNGRFLLADPGRRWAGEFRRRMRAVGWREVELDLIEEPPLGTGTPSLVQITEWRRDVST